MRSHWCFIVFIMKEIHPSHIIVAIAISSHCSIKSLPHCLDLGNLLRIIGISPVIYQIQRTTHYNLCSFLSYDIVLNCINPSCIKCRQIHSLCYNGIIGRIGLSDGIVIEIVVMLLGMNTKNHYFAFVFIFLATLVHIILQVKGNEWCGVT